MLTLAKEYVERREDDRFSPDLLPGTVYLMLFQPCSGLYQKRNSSLPSQSILMKVKQGLRASCNTGPGYFTPSEAFNDFHYVVV